jgi:hypothetical protein
LTAVEDNDRPVILTSLWSPDSGNFSLSYEDNWGTSGEITGIFTTDGDRFRLAFDDVGTPGMSSLTITISGQPGAQIRQIEFINIDQWDEGLLVAIEDMMWDLMF